MWRASLFWRCIFTYAPDYAIFIWGAALHTLRDKKSTEAKGLNFFSVRNQNDNSYGKGVEVDKGIYEINGFQIRFFTEKVIRDLEDSEYF